MGHIHFSCPHCQALIEADAPDAGRETECTECRRLVTVPGRHRDIAPRDVEEERRTASVHEKVSQVLTSEERIEYIAVQSRPLVNIAPDAVVLTNRRFIIYHQKLFGRVHFEDYVWRSLADVRLREGLLASTVYFQIAEGVPAVIDWLPKAQARRVYAIAQEMEERVMEERRLREMEEKRAAAGGVIIQGGAHALPGAPAPDEDPVHKLKQLKEMLDAGLITAGEYEAKRQAILSRM